MPERNRYWLYLWGQFRSWPIQSDGPFAHDDMRYFAHVFRIFDDLVRAQDLDVIVTLDCDGPLPMQGPNTVVLCIEDERARLPRYAYDVRCILKTYGVHRRPYVAWPPPAGWSSLPATLALELGMQLRRAPYVATGFTRRLRHGRNARVLDVPLGTKAYTDRAPSNFDTRALDVVFAGSWANFDDDLNRRFTRLKTRYRHAFIHDLEQTLAARPQVRSSTHVVPSTADARQRQEAYLAELDDARIALCPRGSSRDTYRLFEAARAGAVPVCEPLPRRDFYANAPIVTIRSWRHLGDVLDDLLGDPVGLHERHEAVLRWYAEQWAPEPVGRNFARFVDGVEPR
ncbi:MAG: hypothetical protein ACJ735_01635 [Actinomycetes bacterium]